MVGRLVCFWDGPFSGDTLVLGRVTGVIVPMNGVVTRLIAGRGPTLYKVTPAPTTYRRGCFSLIFFCFRRKRARWWFQRFFIFAPTWGNDPIWLIDIFQMGWFNHQLERYLSLGLPKLWFTVGNWDDPPSNLRSGRIWSSKCPMF